MTQPFTTPRPEPKRDRYGRYLLPDPDTGQERAWTRVTTFAKTISDMYGLGKWQERMVAKGIATRSDLYALAAATPIDDKAKFDRICDDAKEAAKASSGANLGTALHAFTEQLDAGDDVRPPEPWDKDLVAYRAATTKAGFVMQPAWIERVVIFPAYGVAGTLDRLVTHPGVDRHRVADVKTGRELSYSWGEIAVQLALYANSSLAWNPTSGQYEPLPPIDQDTALVLHLPVGQARCDLYDIDIAAGIEAAQLCQHVRGWRARKNIAAPHAVSFPQPSPMADELLAEIAATGSRDAMLALWKRNAKRWTDTHTKAAGNRLAALHATAGIAGGTRETATEGAIA